MPSPAWFLVIATLLPLASFALLVFTGKRMGNPLAGWVATAAIGGSFVCSLAALLVWLSHGTWNGQVWGFGKLPISLMVPWIPVGSGTNQEHAGFLDLGIYIDSLTIAMFGMVTLVSTLVHIFSIGYMHEDTRFPRFFTYLGLFCFSMLGLVIAGTTLQLFVFWELVGLCSYLLIGFWYEKKSASNAAIKAFVTNRVGDFGFLIGFGILFYHLGNATLPDMWQLLGRAGTGEAVTLPGGMVFSAGLLTIMGIGLFFGAVGKSAQFPLHVWLPDAMEGPTPVSALIHAATMVAAGVYLVGRIFPILTPGAKLFIAIIGCTTLTMAALIALAQSDIKKVLAFSTLSQLGYMILAMGVGAWVGGLFHLITHAFFKALLFLGSGSVIHAAHHEQEMPQYGGLWRKIPVTAVTFAVAVLAIGGFGVLGWGFSGFYSKDMILGHAAAFGYLSESEHRSWFYWLLFILPAVIAYITPFYMTRCWMLTFGGKPRNHHVYEHAHELPVMYGPLIVLAVMSVIAGSTIMFVPNLIESATGESQALVNELAARNAPGTEPPQIFATAWKPEIQNPELGGSGFEVDTPPQAAHDASMAAHDPSLSETEHLLAEGEHLMHNSVGFAWLIGIVLGVLVYWNGYALVDKLMKIPGARAIHTWLYRRMYFDELYNAIFVGVTIGLSRFSGWFDSKIVDGLVNLAAGTVRRLSDLAGLNDTYVVDGAVNGVAEAAQGLGAAVRAPQTGRIRLYITILVAAIALGLAGAIVVALS